MKQGCFLSVGVGCALLACGALAQSQSPSDAEKYPSKPIRAIVPSSAGGVNDVLARLLGAKMSERWGQQVVADLRPGAGGIIGSEVVAKAAPDGYTILVVAGGYAFNTLLYSKLPYDTFKDFERVTIVAFAPNVLVVHPSLPVHSVRELIALAKARPGTLNYASSGVGTSSYLSAELFLRLADVKILHVPYKGAGASTNAVISGEAPIIFSGPSNVLPFLEAKRLRALGVTAPKRMSIIPAVPAISETLPGYEVQGFYGVLVPAKTPRPIIDKLRGEIVRILNLPDVRDRLLALGFLPVGNSPEEFTAYVQSEIVKWGKTFKELGIKPES
ncbi:MAG: tripartite tricarboxylate transporter substrate binding protein [Betaproteobacteria bacterium]|nr:tripartite tricarboxylate transporter substrate binding protein [Betaproteobacteria bacterium]